MARVWLAVLLLQANGLSYLLWRGRRRVSRAVRRRRDAAATRCFADPAAWRASVRFVYRELLEQGLGVPSPVEDADLVLVQEEQRRRYEELRAATGAGFLLNQLPQVTSWLHDKRRFYAVCAGKPYALEWHQERCRRPLAGLWIEKPAGGDKGRDLRVLRDPGQWSRPGYLLQRYVDDPLLVAGRKSEVRVLVCVCDDGSYALHREGLVRCAHRRYSADDLDPLIHNSNTSFQASVGIWRYVHCLLSDLPGFGRAMAQIEQAVDDTIAAARHAGVFGGSGDFELLGYDFVLDRAGRVYALEANRHPGLYFATRACRRFYTQAIRSFFASGRRGGRPRERARRDP